MHFPHKGIANIENLKRVDSSLQTIRLSLAHALLETRQISHSPNLERMLLRKIWHIQSTSSVIHFPSLLYHLFHSNISPQTDSCINDEDNIYFLSTYSWKDQNLPLFLSQKIFLLHKSPTGDKIFCILETLQDNPPGELQ